MKILIVDQGECALVLALRAAEAGHLVYWFIEDKKGNNQETGTGMHKNIRKVTEWLPLALKVDLIISAENGKYLEKLEQIRKRGVAVFAPSPEVAALEIDRAAGLKLFEKHGLPVPEYKTFKNLKQAEDYVWKTDGRYVFKTLGDNENKALSYVSKSPEQMIQQLRFWQDTNVKIKGEVLLQEFIEGIEFAAGRWFGKDGPIGPYEESQEHKKLHNGEKGPNTGEQGTALKYVYESKLGDMLIKPLEEDLTQMGCFTSFDLNTIIDKKGQPWILEPTCRMGYPALLIQAFLHQGDPVQWMFDACKGLDTFQTSFDTGIGVVLSIPDYPYYNAPVEEVSNLPIYGITSKNRKHIQPSSLKQGKFIDRIDDKIQETNGWVTSGSYCAVVVGSGSTIEDARDEAYGIIDDLSLSNMAYRTDIGEKTIEALPELQEHGFATGWNIEKPEEE